MKPTKVSIQFAIDTLTAEVAQKYASDHNITMHTDKRHIYTVLELSDIFNPIFEQYGVKRAILFGSYAKGKATAKSDIDILVDSGLRGLNS